MRPVLVVMADELGQHRRQLVLVHSRYQSLPVLDWLESRPSLAQASTVPAELDLARGLPRVMPLLVIRDYAHTVLPAFGPPPYFQRTIAGVRDASRILLGSPGDTSQTRYPSARVWT